MASMTKTKPEALRDRDLNRYYQPYKNAQARNDANPPHLKASVPAMPQGWCDTTQAHSPHHSSDRALTAFAQLATFRLKVRRCLISLVDSRYQYVLTEATKTLSLSRHTIDEEDDRLWFGETVVDTNDMLCRRMFGSTYTAVDPDGRTYTGDGLVVEDMRQVDEFKDKPYVTGPPDVIFYAAVPIRTKSGHAIGAYGCASNVPRPGGLRIAEFRFMQDMAETVMEHLEMIRDREDRTKGERMVRGLSEFIEGSSALGKPGNIDSSKPKLNTRKTAHIDGKDSTTGLSSNGWTSSVLRRQTHNINLMASEDSIASPDTEDSALAPLERKISGGSGRRIVQPLPSNPHCIFYRAADIIRKSTLADGAIFFRSAGPSMKAKAPAQPVDESSMDESHSQSHTSGSEDPGVHTAQYRGHASAKSTKHSKSKASSRSKDSPATKSCEVLGLSLVEDVLDDGAFNVTNLQFPEKSMERYIRKFPYGKFFSFTATGSGLSSGETESEAEPQAKDRQDGRGHKSNGVLPKHNAKGKRERFIPTEILKILPAIRTLIFLPLWDAAAERWIAGGFIWTSQAGALLSPENELPYLKAFGNSITSEYARMNALISDRAKSDFISSISHETRSPLHGILGSTEFLCDTELSQYQQGLVASVETCAKTLLETLEHILDYAKINKLYNPDRNTRRLQARLKRKDNESSIMGPTTDVDLHQLLEEVAEAVCSGHAFRETHAGSGFPSANPKSGGTSNLNHLAVSIEIAPRLDRLVRTQPGAIRRIIMNLLGNSLKYTSKGFVAVRMQAQEITGDTSKVGVVLLFIDSGKGMSVEYQRTRMFSPFSQEDPFADGTGLGLSIVRQIVDSLGGQLTINSTKDVGTTIEVRLTLEVADQRPDTFEDTRKLTTGKRVSMVNTCHLDGHLGACKQAFIANTSSWFGIDVLGLVAEHVTADDTLEADALLCHESASNFRDLAVGTKPLLVVCNNQSNQVALRRALMTTLPPCSRSNVHIVAQPLGPRKLANVFGYMFAPRPHPGTPHRSSTEDVLGMSSRDVKQEHDEFNPPLRPRISGSIASNSMSYGATLTPEVSPPVRQPAVDDGHADKLQEGRATSAEDTRPGPLRLGSGLGHDSPPTAHNILLVDDNAINLQLLVMFMRKIKLSHSSASDGLQAFEKYKHCVESKDGGNTCFTYVLMDISMPVMDGLESTRKIREYEQSRGIKKAIIVALTGLASADAQQNALDAGVDYYLPKPVRFADLKKLMDM